MSESMERTLVMDALKMAHQRRKPRGGLMIHSDRGSQYASEDYRKLVERYGMCMSMSRRGNSWDNAPMESFFAYIEVFYNRERLHSSLGYMTPADYERQLGVSTGSTEDHFGHLEHAVHFAVHERVLGRNAVQIE